MTQNNKYRRIVSVGLTDKDYEALNALSKSKKKTMSEMVRASVRHFLANQNALDLENTDRLYVAELRELTQEMRDSNKQNTDRICKMLSRLMLENGVLYTAAFNELGQEDFHELLQLTRERIYKRLRADEEALANLLQKVVRE